MSNQSQTQSTPRNILVPGEAGSDMQLTIQDLLLSAAMSALNQNYSKTEAPTSLQTIPVYQEKTDKWGLTDARVTTNLASALMEGLGSEVQVIVASYVDSHGGELFPDQVDKAKYGTKELDEAAYNGCAKTGNRVYEAINKSLQTKLTDLQRSQKDAMYSMNKAFFNGLYEQTKAKGSKQTYQGLFGSGFKQVYKVKKGRIEIDSVVAKQCGLKDPLTWSQFTFFAWKKYVEEKKGPGTGVFDTLKEVSVEAISNERTKAIIRACHRVAGKDFTTTTTFPYKNTWTYKDHKDQFIALLGTPNFLGTGWLLADHNDELGGYTIDSIETELPGPHSDWWATITFKKIDLPH